MTEREKMLSGELYDPTDKELEQLRLNARKLARKYNSTAKSCFGDRIFRVSKIRNTLFNSVTQKIIKK